MSKKSKKNIINNDLLNNEINKQEKAVKQIDNNKDELFKADDAKITK